MVPPCNPHSSFRNSWALPSVSQDNTPGSASFPGELPVALDPATLADDGRGYRLIEPGGLTSEDGRNYAKLQMQRQEQAMSEYNVEPRPDVVGEPRPFMRRVDPGQLSGSQVPGALVPADAPTSVKLADVATRHADMFDANDLAVVNSAVVELQAYEVHVATPEGAPVNIDVPYVSQTNDILTCTMGNWENEPSSYTYQWQIDGTSVGSMVGTDPATYTVAVNDVDRVATCIVTASNGVGSTAAPPSNEVVIAAPSGL